MSVVQQDSSPMVHVCVFFSIDGGEWADYLTHILTQKEPDLQVMTFDVNGQDSGTVHNGALLKVLLVTPDFLSHFSAPEPPWLPNTNHKSSKVMVLLCAVVASQLPREIRNSDWKILTVENSDLAIKKLLTNIAQEVDECAERSPPKVKPKPPGPSSRVRVTQNYSPCTDSAATGTVAIPVRSKIPIQRVLPDKPVPGGKLTVIFNQPPGGKESIEMEINDERITPKVLNPYTYELKLPEGLQGRVQMYIFQGSESVNSYRLSLETPDFRVFTYKGMLTQALGIPDGDDEALDQKLAEMFSESLPGGNLEGLFSGSLADSLKPEKSDKHQPTVLHFAAYNGLRELCCRLLETPGALLAYQTENCEGHDPAQLADEAGHTELAEYLRNFVETHITVKMVDSIYEVMNGHSLIYANTRPGATAREADLYSYLPMDGRSRDSSEANEDDDIDESEYMRGHLTDIVPERLSPKKLPRSSSEKFKTQYPSLKADPLPKSASMPRGFCFGNETPSPGTVGSRSQEELKRIQMMVVRGKFSMQDSQKLFEAWKLRYDTPSSSFKERQKALDDLRKEFRATLESAEDSRGKSHLGHMLNRIRSSRKTKSNMPSNITDQGTGRYIPCNFISPPIYEQSEEDPRYEIYSQALQDRSSNGSSYSSASGGSRGSRTSTDSSGLGSSIEADINFSTETLSTGQQVSRREKVAQDTSSLMTHTVPSLPRANRPKLRLPMSPPPARR